MYSENLFVKIEQYNDRFKDSFPMMIMPSGLEEREIVDKIDECLASGKKIHAIVDWFDTFDNPEIDG